MRSWNSPGSHIFGCQDVSGILGSFLDISLLGIIIRMENELNPQFLVQVLFELRGCHKYCGFSNSLPGCGQVTEFGPVLECSPHGHSCAVSSHLCVLIPASPPRGAMEPLAVGSRLSMTCLFTLFELLESGS